MVTDLREASYQHDRAITLNAKAHQEGIDFCATSIKGVENDVFAMNDRINKQEVALEKDLVRLERRHDYSDKRINELDVVTRMLRIHETSKAD